MLRRSFHAMGTDMELMLDAPARVDALRAMAEAEREIRRLEGLLSRFDSASELSKLNASGSMRVGPELLELVELALAARARTGGRFDPTVHDALVAAGYDRSFDQLQADLPDGALSAFHHAGAVRVDRSTSSIELEPGVRLDLGRDCQGLRGRPRGRDPRRRRFVPRRCRRRHRAFVAAPGRSACRRPTAHSPSSSSTAPSPRPAATGVAGRATARNNTT